MSQMNRMERRERRRKKKELKRQRYLEMGFSSNRRRRVNRHHIKNVVNHGPTCRQNILILDVEKHNWIHKIFRNLDFYDIIIVLIRTCRAKHYEDINPKIVKFYELL